MSEQTKKSEYPDTLPDAFCSNGKYQYRTKHLPDGTRLTFRKKVGNRHAKERLCAAKAPSGEALSVDNPWWRFW